MKASSDLAKVYLVVDLEGFRIPTKWVMRSLRVDGLRIDPYLWGPKTRFAVQEMGWRPVYAHSEAGTYQYDHPMQKHDPPWPVYRSIEYAMRHVHALECHPPDIVYDQQEEYTGNVKWDLYRLYCRY